MMRPRSACPTRWPVPCRLPHPPEEVSMARVTLNTLAPDFTLDDYTGRPVRLADFRGRQWVLVVFNRGFL